MPAADEMRRNKQIASAWRLIRQSDFPGGRAILERFIRECGDAIGALAEDIADAEECLALVSLIEMRNSEALAHAQQAILRSGRFRPGAHFLAARALAHMNIPRLAVSKLRIVSDQSSDLGLAALALAEIAELTSSADEPGQGLSRGLCGGGVRWVGRQPVVK